VWQIIPWKDWQSASRYFSFLEKKSYFWEGTDREFLLYVHYHTGQFYRSLIHGSDEYDVFQILET
jgi:hypothetical protein